MRSLRRKIQNAALTISFIGVGALEGQIVTRNPLADAYVNSSSPTSNFGGVGSIYARTNTYFSELESYLKFDLAGMASVKSAKLRLFARVSGSSGGLLNTTTFKVANTSWIETGSGSITWNNSMGYMGAAIASAAINGTTEQWYEYNITGYVAEELAAGKTLLSLGLQCITPTGQANNSWVMVRSREAASNKPELVCELNALPTVSLVEPQNGANLVVGASVNLVATASDSDGQVSKVEFFANNSLVGQDTSSPYGLAWVPTAPGAYSLKAKATDDSGGTAESSTVTVTVVDADSDYDGRGNRNELLDGTDPFNPSSVSFRRLSRFGFNNPPSWIEPAGDPTVEPVGHTPLFASSPPYLTGPTSWSGTAAEFTLGGAGVGYREVETDANGVWFPNINLRNGAVRFWFRPNWDGPWLRAYSGVVAHYSSHGEQTHRHYFTGATTPMVPDTYQKLFTYVYLDPNDPPEAVMLEFHEPVGGWEHRAYWGSDAICQQMGWANCRYQGPLPPLGQWVRLEVFALDLDLDQQSIDGMSFVLYGGRAKWDRSGKLVEQGCPVATVEEVWFDDSLPANAVLSTAGGINEAWSFGLSWSRLVELGSFTWDGSYGLWQLALTPDGSTLGFGAHSNGVANTFLNCGVNFKMHTWNQIVLNYTPSNSQLYVNGTILTNGQGINVFPPASVRDDGIEIGSNESGAVCDGQIEELEFFNYPLDRLTIAREYPNFNAPNQTEDTDYDGRSDIMEVEVDLTDPGNEYSVRPVRLGHWRFDNSGFTGEQGQVPLSGTPVVSQPAISGAAAQFWNSTHNLVYRDVEANGQANINCREGTVRFWFRPIWTSGSAPSEVRLLEVGGRWAIGIKDSGTKLAFWEDRLASSTPKVEADINWQSGRWHQIVLRYFIGWTELYVDGVAVALGPGVYTVPNEGERENNFRIGHSQSGGLLAEGTIDELETFNYVIDWTEIQPDYERVRAQDPNANGVPEFTEEPYASTATPFSKAPVVVTGVLNAEQYDRGGDGVGYHSGIDYDNVLYRTTELLIEPCTDLGGGYSVNQLSAGDWLQYTFEVRLSGYYTLDARVSHVGSGAVGGEFRYQFVDAYGSIISLGPICQLQAVDGWHNSTSPGVYLDAGIHRLRIFMMENASDGYAGNLNYISIYPAVPFNDQFPALVADVGAGGFGAFVEGEAGVQLSTAQANSATLQAAVDHVLLNGGGTVQIPAGTYYLAQHPTRTTPPYDTVPRNSGQTFAVSVLNWSVGNGNNSNIRIRGSQSGQTVLKAHNRAVSFFVVGNGFGFQQTVSQTNVTFEHLTFKGRPHTRYDTGVGTYESGQFDNGIAYQGCGAMIVGSGFNQLPLRNLNILNCEFINAPVVPIILAEVDGALIQSNRFIFHTTDSPDGDMAGAVLLNDGVTTANDLVWVGVFSGAAAHIGVQNIVTVDNYFDGNERDPVGDLHSADGIVWHQSGGNFYVGRNEVRNYGLEGVQYNSGPGSVVQNQFITTQKSASTAALVAFGTCNKSLTMDNADQVFTFVGNLVQGGRHAYLGAYFATSTNDPLYNVHFCDNDVDVDPPPPNTWWVEFPSAALTLANCGYANVSGNLVRRAGYGAYFAAEHLGSEFMRNDFGRVDRLGLLFETVNSSIESVIIAHNILGSGQYTPAYQNMYSHPSLGHLRFHLGDARKFFLIGNQYRDINYVPNQLILDPPGAPVNLK